MRMSLKRTSEFAKRDNILDIKESCHTKSQVETWRLVPSGPHDSVPSLPCRILRIKSCSVKIQCCCKIHDRKRSARVTGTSSGEANQIIAAHHARRFFQLSDG